MYQQEPTTGQMSTAAYDKLTMVKALELTDEDLAIKVMSDPNLDSKELNIILTASLLGRVVNKKTKEPLKLSNKVMMAGFNNLLNRVSKDLDNSI